MIIVILLWSVFVILLVSIKRIKNNKQTQIDNNDTIADDPIIIEQIEHYDRQIDGYTQLIKLLDYELKNEVNNGKKAQILNKQLATLEKLNKTIIKLEKLRF